MKILPLLALALLVATTAQAQQPVATSGAAQPGKKPTPAKQAAPAKQATTAQPSSAKPAVIAPAKPTAAVQPATPPPAPVPEPAPQPEPVAPAPSEDLECHVLTGRVANSEDAPLLGASVILHTRDKNFSLDAFSTNSEGQYMVTSKRPIPRNAILEISAAGYTSFEKPLADCQPLSVTLEVLPGTKFKSDGRIKRTEAAGKIKVR